MKRLSEANLRYGFPKSVKFHFYSPVFGLFCDFIKNFIVRFIHEDDVNPTWFFPDNIYNLSFSDKKKSNPKILPAWVFVPPKCQQNFDVLQLVWTLIPKNFWIKSLRCLIFALTIVFHLQWIEFLEILSYHYEFFKKNKISIFN